MLGDVFEGADKRVWQFLKEFKNDKEFNYVIIKSKTLICHFCQTLCWVRNDQNGYEMTKWVRNDQKRVRNDLGTN